MTIDEAKKAFDEMRAQGADDNAILGTLYSMFQDDKIDVNQLGALVNVLGYELTEDFKKMSPEDQKTKGYEEGEEDKPAEGVTKEEVEKAKEFGDDEDEKKPETDEEDKGSAAETEDEKPSSSDEKEDEEEERKEAERLFGFDKK